MSRYLGQGDGSDGVVALGSYTQTWYSCSGTASASTLSVTGTFSAGDRVFIIQSRGTGVGNYEDNRVASYVAGTLTLVHPLENTYTDSGASQAQIAVVKEASSVTGSLTVSAWDGNVNGVFVMACSGIFSATVNGTGKGYVGGVAQPKGSNGKSGEGTIGASATQTSANGNAGGGAGLGSDVNHSAGGGGGSYATSGTSGVSDGGTAGSPGSTVGSADLSSGLFMGGAGGSGARGNQPDGGSNGSGGNGGAIVVIYGNNFSNTASILVNGSNGGTAGQDGGGGGAGAGGTIFIKGTYVSLGSSLLSAVGGTGGGHSGSGSNGGNGGNGRIRIEACSITGSTNPTASTSIGGHNWCGILGGMI